MNPTTTNILLTNLASEMKVQVPKAMLKANPERFETLSIERLSFLVFYGHKVEAGEISDLRTIFNDWQPFTARCFGKNWCYVQRDFYNKVFLSFSQIKTK